MTLNRNRLVATVTLVLVLGALAALPLLAQTSSKTPPPAQELINAALKTAKAENKTVMVDFSASWCGWCKRLDTFLHSPEVGKLMSDNYVFVTLIVQETPDKKALENPGAGEMMNEMGGSGLPFYFFLDKEGKKLADSMAMPGHKNIGHPGNAEEIKAFDGLLEQTAPRLTKEQRAKIADYLTKMITAGNSSAQVAR